MIFNIHNNKYMRTQSKRYVQNDLWSYGGEVAPASAMIIPTNRNLPIPSYDENTGVQWKDSKCEYVHETKRQDDAWNYMKTRISILSRSALATVQHQTLIKMGYNKVRKRKQEIKK